VPSQLKSKEKEEEPSEQCMGLLLLLAALMIWLFWLKSDMPPNYAVKSPASITTFHQTLRERS
jgi:hypothetical protein